MFQSWVFVVLLIGATLAANPESPRSRPGSPSRLDCSGAVGVSAAGAGSIPQIGLIPYRRTLVNNGVEWNQNTGELTIRCPGMYFVSYTAHGDNKNTRAILKKLPQSQRQWEPIVSSGTVDIYGGSNSVLLDLQAGDKLGLWLSTGNIKRNVDNEIPTTTFTAFKINGK